KVGDEIIIGIPENAVVAGSALVYLIPLLALFAAALLAQAFGASEPLMILAGFSGMGLGFAAVRWHGRRSGSSQALTPRVVGRALSTGVVSDIRERSEY